VTSSRRLRQELPWVEVEKEYKLRDRRRDKVASRSSSTELAAPDLPLHVRPGLRGRLPPSAADRRQPESERASPEGSRHQVDDGLPGAPRRSSRPTRSEWAGTSTGPRPREATSTATSASSTRRRSSRPFLAGDIPPVVDQMAERSGTTAGRIRGREPRPERLHARGRRCLPQLHQHVRVASSRPWATTSCSIAPRSGAMRVGPGEFWLHRHDEY